MTAPSTPPGFFRSLDLAAADLGMYPPVDFRFADDREDKERVLLRRRRGELGAGGGSCLLELHKENNVLLWKDGFAPKSPQFSVRASSYGNGYASRGETGKPDAPVAQLQFERLKPNDISTWLDTLDRKLTPLPRGLLRLDPTGETWLEDAALPAEGSILLLVHGTFSSSGNFLKELRSTPQGEAFLANSLRRYDAVLAFEHSTLSVSPWLNAVELARALDHTRASVDLIAHSRGGLVARWWADWLDRNPRQRRCILVGSPLAGTSLAAPASIRNAMNLFTNVASGLEATATLASSMIPLLSVVAGLLKIVGSVTEATAKLPIADAVISAIPGLSGQSATSNNFELQSLRRGRIANDTHYHAVRSDFQPEPLGWKFWRYFTDIGRPANDLVDRLIFRQANDIVVDCDHMTSFADDGDGATLPQSRVLDLGTNSDVWHCNYFRREPVIRWMEQQLA